MCLIAALAAGCGGQATADLAGKVTIGGQPLPDDATGSVQFTPPGGSKAQPVSALIENGSYTANGVPQGAVRVSFAITQPVGPKQFSERTGQEYQETRSLVPGNRATGIELTVEGDNPNQDFDL